MKDKKDKSVFIEYFGDTSQIRVIDFLIENYFFDYPMTEIAKESNVGYNSIKIFFPNFIKNKIIVKTRKVGKSDYYKLNTDNPFIKELMKLDWNLTENNSFSEIKEKELIKA